MINCTLHWTVGTFSDPEYREDRVDLSKEVTLPFLSLGMQVLISYDGEEEAVATIKRIFVHEIRPDKSVQVDLDNGYVSGDADEYREDHRLFVAGLKEQGWKS